MNCRNCKSALPDLLLDPESSVALDARRHLESCAACAEEFSALQGTFALLDTWEAPEVSPYFDQKLAVRLREEQAAEPAGFWERLRDRISFNTGRQFRPLLAGALAALILAAGGGIGMTTFSHQTTASASATVNDLQILDRNAKELQQVDQILQESATDDSGHGAIPQS
jgi:hypothetical protein